MAATGFLSYSIIFPKNKKIPTYMRLKPLPTICIISLLAFLLVSCNAPKALEYRDFKNFTLDKPSFSSTPIKMNLIYYNPNNFGMELNRTDLDIYINNNYLGKASQEYQVAIPRRAEFSIPVTMDVDMKNLLKNGFITLLSNEVMIKVIGTVKVGKLNVFKTFPVNYEGKQQFTLF